MNKRHKILFSVGKDENGVLVNAKDADFLSFLKYGNYTISKGWKPLFFFANSMAYCEL